MKSLRKLIQETISSILDEGLIRTQKAELSINKLNSLFKENLVAKLNVEREVENLGVIDVFITKYDTEILEQIIVIINNLGYIISKFSIEGFSQSYNKETLFTKLNLLKIITPIYFRLEQKRDLNTNEIPLILYHVTHARFIDKIKRIGLVPKSQSKNTTHPDRIYLAKTEELAQKLAQEFSNMEYKNDHNYILLEIDTTKLLNIQLHRDPNTRNGYFILENIPPTAINFYAAKALNIN